MEKTVGSEQQSQPIAKQINKPKKKSKTMLSERPVEDNCETSQAQQESKEINHAFTERLRIDECEVLVNGDIEKHNNNVSFAAKAKLCTDKRNNCCNQHYQSDIKFDETNLGNEKCTEQTHSSCNNLEKVCNGMAHSPPDDKASTSFDCTDMEPKSLLDVGKLEQVTATLATTTITSSSSSTPSDNIASDNIHPEQQDIVYKVYENELQMPDIMRLIQKDLSEPYSIYTYRYFIHNWPKLCFLAMHGTTCVGAIVCKLDIHRQQSKRGYIVMLAVDKDYRKLKIFTNLVAKAIQAMLVYNADEVVLETEITNIPALRLYENLGFVRDKRLFGYYLNGVDALRLKLWFR